MLKPTQLQFMEKDSFKIIKTWRNCTILQVWPVKGYWKRIREKVRYKDAPDSNVYIAQENYGAKWIAKILFKAVTGFLIIPPKFKGRPAWCSSAYDDRPVVAHIFTVKLRETNLGLNGILISYMIKFAWIKACVRMERRLWKRLVIKVLLDILRRGQQQPYYLCTFHFCWI